MSNITVMGNPVEVFKFPGGEVNVRLPNVNWRYIKPTLTWIKAIIQSSDDLMALMLTVDAVRRDDRFNNKIGLYIPYLPYSRQDRVCNKGEALSLSVVLGMINSLHAVVVTTDDVHSDVAKEILPYLVVHSQLSCMQNTSFAVGIRDRYDYIVAPDKGATEKAKEIADEYDLPLIQAHKHRDMETGRITDISIENPPRTEYNKALIVDDICDGGATFTTLGKLLRSVCNMKSVDLYVTHGIFSKGRDLEFIDNTYCYNDLQKKEN